MTPTPTRIHHRHQVHYQSRMASNGIAITPSRSHSAGRQGKMGEGGCVGGWVGGVGWGGGDRTMRIQQDGHQHNHLRRQGAGLFVVVLWLLG